MIGCGLVATALAFAAPLQNANPRIFASRSGELELYVEPQFKFGRGGSAAYELRRGDTLLWARELSITFDDAVVLDDGAVAGFGNAAGNDIQAGPLHVVLLEGSGEVRWDDELPFLKTPLDWHGPTPPMARGILCDEARDRLVVVLRHWRPERDWLVYRLSQGDKLEKDTRPHHPITPEGVPWELVGARSIPGTPLDLVAYMHVERLPDRRQRIDTAHLLIDAEGHPVWSLERPAELEYGYDDDPVLHVPLWCQTILDVSERAFALWHAGSSERIDYRVERAGDGDWTAVEVSRSPHDPTPAVVRAAALVQAIELEALGATRLRSERGEDEEHWPSAVAVAPDGRIFVHLPRSSSVQAFSASGERVLHIRSESFGIDPGKTRGSRAKSPVEHSFAFGPRDDVHLAWNDARLRSASTGIVAAVADEASKPAVGDQMTFVAGTERRWVTPAGDYLTLLDANGQASISHERRPGDRRWLEVPTEHGLAVAPDGSAAVLTECEPISGRAFLVSWAPSPAIALYSTTGEPLRTVPLPADVGERLDFDGRNAVVVAREQREIDGGELGPIVHLVDLATDALQRFTPRIGTVDSLWDVFLAPDGRELWLIDSFELEFHRFALPD